MTDTNAAIVFTIVFLIIILAVLIKKERKKTKMEKGTDNFTIRQSKLIVMTGILISILGVMFFHWLFVLFALLCSFHIISLLNWKITIKDNQIICTSAFGKEKSYTFDYITKVMQKTRGSRGGKITYIEAYHETPDGLFAVKSEMLFTVSDNEPGFNSLLSRLKSEGILIIEDTGSIL